MTAKTVRETRLMVGELRTPANHGDTAQMTAGHLVIDEVLQPRQPASMRPAVHLIN